ncbi:MAG: hypothetical protein HOQ10_09490 [Frateuria sp.]|nr:hypothetical protein [Frateuria sp.]
MSDTIDPLEFGRLQAQVETLLRQDAEKTELLKALAADIQAMRIQMAEARGGWKLMLLLGGAAASFGGAISWGLTHLKA